MEKEVKPEVSPTQVQQIALDGPKGSTRHLQPAECWSHFAIPARGLLQRLPSAMTSIQSWVIWGGEVVNVALLLCNLWGHCFLGALKNSLNSAPWKLTGFICCSGQSERQWEGGEFPIHKTISWGIVSHPHFFTLPSCSLCHKSSLPIAMIIPQKVWTWPI